MLRLVVEDRKGSQRFEHPQGPLVLGRRPGGRSAQLIISDPHVSRNHLRIEELEGGRLRIENLSTTNPVVLSGGELLDSNCSCEIVLPTQLGVGTSQVRIRAGRSEAAESVLAAMSHLAGTRWLDRTTIQQLADSPDAQTLAQWFQTVVAIQQSAATSEEFLDETARAVVDLVGLDRGIVLLRVGEDWNVAAVHATTENYRPTFSRSVLNDVVRRGAMFYKNLQTDSAQDSLINVRSVVAAPMMNVEGAVIGVVYGSRSEEVGQAGQGIRPLEAQLVQVLAAAAGAGLARQEKQREAMRAQIQFEQFFTAQLARELARDPRMLEGRQREVTVMFSDVRGFSELSERMPPRDLFRLMQDVMELQSTQIRETDGVLVDYYGDGLLAMWNAPTDQPDHAQRACRAALTILEELRELNQRWTGVLDQPLGLGIGINTGPALVGNTGSHVKVKYGPMGPTVNLASRVERAVKQLGVPLIATQSTTSRLGPSFATRRLCRARLPGVGEAVDLYEVTAESPSSRWCRCRDEYETALQHFESGRWREACRVIEQMVAWQPDGCTDAPSLALLKTAALCEQSPPPAFDSTIVIQRK